MLEAQSHHGAGAALHMQGLLIISDTAQRAIIFKNRSTGARHCRAPVLRFFGDGHIWSRALRTPQRTVLSGLRAPHPDMRGKVFMGLRPCPDYVKRNICEVPPRAPTVRELYMRGFTPHPEPRWDLSHLADLFWEKVPETRKNRTA